MANNGIFFLISALGGVQPGTRFKKPYMIDYIKKVKSGGGVVSIDVMLYRDGSIDQTQLESVKSY